MTETYTTSAAQHFQSPGELGMVPLGAILDGPLFWDFEFGSLRFVWDLAIGAWNLHDFYKAGFFHKIAQLPI